MLLQTRRRKKLWQCCHKSYGRDDLTHILHDGEEKEWVIEVIVRARGSPKCWHGWLELVTMLRRWRKRSRTWLRGHKADLSRTDSQAWFQIPLHLIYFLERCLSIRMRFTWKAVSASWGLAEVASVISSAVRCGWQKTCVSKSGVDVVIFVEKGYCFSFVNEIIQA